MFSFSKKMIFLSLSVLTFNHLHFSYQIKPKISQQNVTKYFDYKQIANNLLISNDWDFNNLFQVEKSPQIDFQKILLCFYKNQLGNPKNNYDHIIKLDFDYKILLDYLNQKTLDLDIIKIISHIKVENQTKQSIAWFSLEILYEDILYNLYQTKILVNLTQFNFISLQMIYSYL